MSKTDYFKSFQTNEGPMMEGLLWVESSYSRRIFKGPHPAGWARSINEARTSASSLGQKYCSNLYASPNGRGADIAMFRFFIRLFRNSRHFFDPLCSFYIGIDRKST